jgi:TonB family protein
VAVGLLLQESQPVYPPIAKAARVQGTVVPHALISKPGSIENLHVISGPAMLQQAALSVVRTWLYRPHLMYGEFVEIETTVKVIFALSEQGSGQGAAPAVASGAASNGSSVRLHLGEPSSMVRPS